VNFIQTRNSRRSPARETFLFYRNLRWLQVSSDDSYSYSWYSRACNTYPARCCQTDFIIIDERRGRLTFPSTKTDVRRLRSTMYGDFICSITKHTDYCNAVLAGVPKARTNKLQRVLNAAARVVSGTHKFDRGLSRLLHTELHWLDVPERVVYKLGVMVFNCLHGQVPPYLVELCQPVAGVTSRQHLQSATQQLLVVQRHQLRSYARQAFCVAGPSVWNSLPDSLRNPIIGGNSFRKFLKTFLFATY